jgi:hypothetical protein
MSYSIYEYYTSSHRRHHGVSHFAGAEPITEATIWPSQHYLGLSPIPTTISLTLSLLRVFIVFVFIRFARQICHSEVDQIKYKLVPWSLQ